MNKLIFPGSFDPITNGHVEIIKKAIKLCDELVIVVTENTNKTPYIAVEERVRLISDIVSGMGNIKVISSRKMICEVVDELQIYNVVRGLRDTNDFNFEMHMDTYNSELNDKINTVFIIASHKTRHISSSGVKEILKYDKSVAHLVPENIVKYLKGIK